MTSNIDQLYNEGIRAAPSSDESGEGVAKQKLEEALVLIAQALDLLQEPVLRARLDAICKRQGSTQITSAIVLSVH